jgi:hypothetical protein
MADGEIEPARARIVPFRQTALPSSLRLPRWLSLLSAGAVGVAMVAGATRQRHSLLWRLLRATFFGSTVGYGIVALLDLAEHLRLEKETTGHYLRWVAIPPLESALHGALVATNISALALARPRLHPSRARGLWLALAPGALLALGWADELAFHRRRTGHREDIMHTTQHLAEGVMLASHYALLRGPIGRRR